MPPISIMLKPSSSMCNMKCEYCFYHSLATQRESYSHGFMSDETMKTVLKKAFDFTKGQRVNLSFQGGEPLLRGKDFFYRITENIKKYNKHKSEVTMVIQINGTLIDEEWCKFFKDNNILIGISLDGDKAANKYRIDKEGRETFDKVLQSIELLNKYKVDYNVLSVITAYVAENIQNIYKFFKEKEFKFLQFIPCYRPLGTRKGDKNIHMTGKQYGDFLINLFKLYYNDYMQGNYISVRQLDNFVYLAAGMQAEQCGMNGHCSHQFVIEGDGNVYPCDFYCLDEYLMGNIIDTDFAGLAKTKVAIDFIKESMIVEEKCKKCNYYQLCKNGCKRERGYVEKCQAYKKFFDFALPYLQRLRMGIKG